MRRNLFIDYAKGLLILLVTIGHAIQFVVLQDEKYWNDPVFKLLYMFHMPLFMAISGYVSHRGIQRDPFRPLFVGKTAAYVIPIFSWTILEMLLGLLTSKTSVPWRHWPPIIFWGALNNLWFLWALLACVLLTAAVRPAGRYFWGLCALVFAGLLSLPDAGNWRMIKFMYPYFLAGYFVASLGGIAVRRGPYLSALAGLGLFTAWALAVWRKDYFVYTTGMLLTNGNAANVLLRYLIGFGVSGFAVLTMYGWYRWTADSARQFLALLGQNSLYIYIIQFPVFPFIAKPGSKIFAGVESTSFAGSAEAIVIGILLALVCWLAGSFLARNDTAAFLLFGKRKSIPPNVAAA